MKIYCIGRNYADHAKELNNPIPEQPLVFMKPSTAYLQNNRVFFYPDFSKEVHYEGELVIRICKNGKHIAENFAHTYYEQITMGIDFTARDIQRQLKAKGHPWEIAKGFDCSAPVGELMSMDNARDKAGNITFSLHKNGKTVQQGNTRDLLFSFDKLICHISKYIRLQVSDLIFTGTPAGVGEVAIGDTLEGFIGEQKVLCCKVR